MERPDSVIERNKRLAERIKQKPSKKLGIATTASFHEIDVHTVLGPAISKSLKGK